jgi:UDP-N-acetyl-D-glucosamine dehydrogenase
MGYVGLPLALRFSAAGFETVGIESNETRLERLKSSLSLFRHIPAADIDRAMQRGMTFTADLSQAGRADVLVLCLPTPLNEHREPDLSFVTNTCDELFPFLRTGQLVSLESTTYPGTTEELLRPRLEQAGMKVGKDVFLAYSPEREDPGNEHYRIENIPKLVSGCTDRCLEVALALYATVVEHVVPVSSTRVAELAKLLENIHRAVNIGLVNEMKIVADRMGINIYEVIEAASTKPFGFVPYLPGPGLGGHCIPIDPFYLAWKAREYDVDSRFIELAGEVNSAMPAWVVGKITEALNDRGLPVRNSRILVLGLAYKKNVDDLRESSSLEIIGRLRERGARLAYNDPYFSKPPATGSAGAQLRSMPLDDAAFEWADCVVIATDHDAFDFQWIRERARLIVDTRGRYRQPEDHIVMA